LRLCGFALKFIKKVNIQMPDTYKDNYQIWSTLLPRSAELYQKTDESAQPVKYDYTPAELEEWVKHLPLPHYNALVIHGFDQGYAYTLLKPWLQDNPHRIIIFLENNPHSLKNFLSSPEALPFLKDRQVWLYYGNTPEDMDRAIYQFSSTYPLYTIYFDALPKRDPKIVEGLRTIGRFIWLRNRDSAYEYIEASIAFTHNVYSNIYLLPESRDFTPFHNSFKNVPAIIVGAGPSLSKNRHLLHDLKDKALIIAGGTAINALNAGHIQPDLAVGVDPNHQFYNRILSNTAWEVPFVYYYRMYRRAISLVHGDKLFLNLSPGMAVPKWIHDELGISFPCPIQQEFFNVINLATLLAIVMGCNPILFVGLDLAYTDDSSYASGLQSLASQKTWSALRSKHASEEIHIRHDIHGNPIKTLWKWIIESIWYSKLQTDHKDIQFINCTEGGLGFQGITNENLDTVLQRYCQGSLDLTQRMKTQLADSPFCSNATPEQLTEILKKMDSSLERCATIIEEAEKTIEEGDAWEKIELPCLELLKDETAFKTILSVYNQYLQEQFLLHFNRVSALKDHLETYQSEKVAMHKKRYQQMLKALSNNRAAIKQSIETPHLPPLIPLEKSKIPPTSFENNVLRTYYANGVLKSVIPSLYGLPHGEVLLYYHDGSLSRRLTYTQGIKDGIEEIWDRSGQQLIKATYKRGKPIGTAREWHPNGVLSSETTYDDDGNLLSTQYWNHLGIPVQEERDTIDTFISDVQTQMTLLKYSLKNIESLLKQHLLYAPDLESELKSHFERLNLLEEKTLPKQAFYSKDTHEPLWQTPLNIEDITWDIGVLKDAVAEFIIKIQQRMQKVK